MKRISLITLYTVALAYCCAAGYLYFFQRSFLYFPAAETQQNIIEIEFNHQQHTLKTLVVNGGKKHAVIYFAGNSEQVSLTQNKFKPFITSHTLYLVKYRGYGGSTGEPSEQALYADALYIFDQLATQYDSISVVGRSLGTGVATYLAAKRTLKKLVLITPFDSIENIAQRQYPMFPINILLEDKYQSDSRVDEIAEPTLIILSQTDRIVPHAHSENLITLFPPDQVVVKTIKQTDHNSIMRSNETIKAIAHYLLPE